MKKIPILKFNENHEPYIDGNYKFELSNDAVFTDDFIPSKEITFKWSVESMQDMYALQTDNELNEMFGEKLKQDFITFLKEKSKLNK